MVNFSTALKCKYKCGGLGQLFCLSHSETSYFGFRFRWVGWEWQIRPSAVEAGRRMGNSCLPIPFHPNKVQIIPVTVFRKNASEESPGVMIIWWWHQPVVGLSYVDSVFSALERYFQITPTYHRETLYLLEDILKWWHINPEFRRLPGCQVAGFFWKGFRWPALGLMPTKMQHLSPFNYVQQVIYESNEGSVTHQVSIKWI